MTDADALDRPDAARHDPRRPVPLKGPSAREYYRLDYPLVERPRFVSGSEAWLVCEVSEGGMQLEMAVAAAALLEVDQVLAGALAFRHAEEVEVRGQVMRVQGTRVSVRFEPPGVPWATVLEEERAILARYRQR
jgi:hypothetical protein